MTDDALFLKLKERRSKWHKSGKRKNREQRSGEIRDNSGSRTSLPEQIVGEFEIQNMFTPQKRRKKCEYCGKQYLGASVFHELKCENRDKIPSTIKPIL